MHASLPQSRTQKRPTMQGILRMYMIKTFSRQKQFICGKDNLDTTSFLQIRFFAVYFTKLPLIVMFCGSWLKLIAPPPPQSDRTFTKTKRAV